LPESHRLVESRVEEALISRLQDFLLELGSGFAFIGRQVRLTLDGDHFYPDLVFYHAKLKCYVVIDLKVEKLTHGDLGQMQMYVNYYDREIAEPGDQPTIGLILCADKNEAMVRYVLDEKANRSLPAATSSNCPAKTYCALKSYARWKNLIPGARSHEPPRQRHRRPPQSATSAASLAGNPRPDHRDRPARQGGGCPGNAGSDPLRVPLGDGFRA
jgi:hypothetical protein